MVLVASSYLKGVASQDYMLHEQEFGKHTWAEFKAWMAQQYTPANQNQLIRENIKKLFQTSSVKDYYIEFRKLANQSSTMTNEERMSWFVAHLKPDLRQHCNMQECKTLEEAYSKAVHKETFTERLEPHTSAIYYTTSQQQPFSNIKIDGSSLPLQEKKVNFAQPHQNQN